MGTHLFAGLLRALWLQPLLIAFGIACFFNVQAKSQQLIVTVEADVVAQPCTLRSGDEILSLDFGSMDQRTLLAQQRTAGMPLVIHLDECSTDVFEQARVTFKGQEAPELPQYLAISSGSQASGIAIGFEDQHKMALPINRPDALYPLSNGDNALTFYTYVQVLPSALAQKSLNSGAFQAQATFYIEYE